VWIAPTHGLIFTIAPNPFTILIAFVAGYIDHDTSKLKLPNRFQKMNGTHNVGGVGPNGILVSAANYRLGGQVNDYIRAAFGQSSRQPWKISDVCTKRSDRTPYLSLFEKAGLGRGGKRITSYRGTE